MASSVFGEIIKKKLPASSVFLKNGQRNNPFFSPYGFRQKDFHAYVNM